jgi:hypothetical protein
MRALIESIARHLVEYPDRLSISEVLGECTLIFEVRCDPRDTGKLIGKNGRTVSALRTLVNSAASNGGKKAVVEVVA